MISNAELADLLNANKQIYKTLVVDGFIVNDSNDAILLQKRSPDRRLFPNFWDALGGHLEEGETLQEALQREVLEESQMELTEIIQLVHQFEWPEDPSAMNFQFLCRAKVQFVPEAGKITEARWIRQSDLASIQAALSPSMLAGVSRAFHALKSL